MDKQSKRGNLKGPGTCIFCGAYGLTKEHMWPDWLRNYIPRNQDEHQISSTLTRVNGDEVSYQRRSGDPHSRRIHCVCKPCNSGWMSRLQSSAKPILVPMLEGRDIVLLKNSQTILAAWVGMTVMVAEFASRDKVAIPYSDRVFLRMNQRPPSHWRIWIGSHRRQQQPMFAHNVLTFTKQKSQIGFTDLPLASNTQTTTICLGEHLVIYAMSSEIARNIIRRWRLPTQIAPTLSQIWPVKSGRVTWPAKFGLNDAGIQLLAGDFYDKATKLIREIAVNEYE
jgi:hypothetical protein